MYVRPTIAVCLFIPLLGFAGEASKPGAPTVIESPKEDVKAAGQKASEVVAAPPAEDAGSLKALGLRLCNVPENLAMHLPSLLSGSQGLLVTEVTADSPLAQAIRQFDIIHSLDSVPLFSQEQLIKRLTARTPQAQIVTLGVIHRGTFSFRVATLPAAVSEEKFDSTATATSQVPPVVRPKPVSTPSAVVRSAAISSRDGLIAIVSADGVNFDVQVIADHLKQTFTGDRAAIVRQIQGLSEPLRAAVEDALTGPEPCCLSYGEGRQTLPSKRQDERPDQAGRKD